MEPLELDGAANRVLDQLVDRGRRAKSEGFHIESIAIRYYILDTWMRRFLANWDSAPSRKAEFAKLLEQSRRAGLDETLADRISHFNVVRRAAIHRLLWNEVAYEDLFEEVFAEDEHLVHDVEDWMAISAGLPRPKMSG